MDRLGNGTYLVNCPHCGIQMMNSLLISHMQTDECKNKAQKNYVNSNLEFLRTKSKELEETIKDKKD